MQPETLTKFIKLQGYRTYRSESSYWYDKSQQVYQAFSYHKLITSSNDENLIILDKKSSWNSFFHFPMAT
jgi:hypothetical protein